MTKDFTFEPAEWIPFKDKKVLERVRNIKREDMERHNNPDFKIKIVPDVGALLAKGSWLEMKEMEIELEGWLDILVKTGLLEAGQLMEDWCIKESSVYRYGYGAITNKTGARVKWSFEGSAVKLYMQYADGGGCAEVFLDGESKGIVEISKNNAESSLVFEGEVAEGRLVLSLVCTQGSISVDGISVRTYH